MSKELFADPNQFFVQIVDKAFSDRKVKTYPAVKNYIVHLMQYFLATKNLFEENYPSEQNPSCPNSKTKTFAENYLLAQNTQGAIRKVMLKKIGDKTLYISGFFGDSLNRKLIDVEYYAEIGVSSYSLLAKSIHGHSLDKRIYEIFSKKFLTFVDVLSHMSSHLMMGKDQNILRTYEVYLKTGSLFARERLIELGIFPHSHKDKKINYQDA